MKNEIIRNVDNVKVATNELLINSVLNRNFRRLIENDQRLFPYTSDGRTRYRVMPYVPGKSYSKNELVWFVDYYLSPQNERKYQEEYEELKNIAAFKEVQIDKDDLEELNEKYYTVTLYLLRSLKNNNDSFPKREIVNMVPRFDASGWHNENEFGSIYTDYFEDFTAYTLSTQLERMHEKVAKFHKFGQLSSFQNLDDKVLLADMSNISPDRRYLLFPGVTEELEPDSTILGGSKRVWDTGYIEYNIEFKLGGNGTTSQVYGQDGSLVTVQNLVANYLSLRNRSDFTTPYDQYDNRRYYYQDSDADIFVVDSNSSTNSNEITQNNINSKVNVFSGTIHFDKEHPFLDTNYCIFAEKSPCVVLQGSDTPTTNVNSLVFANKSRQSVTAILIVPTYNGDIPKILYDNVFRCQVCGRWK